MKRIVGRALAGWAAIVALAWWLANKRILICEWERACMVRTVASRDAVLTGGLTVALVGLIVVAFLMRSGRIK